MHVATLERGHLNRASTTTAEAGGKGLNVSRALAAHGHRTLAAVPLSNASAGVYVPLVGSATPLEVVTIKGEVRSNISLVEADGTVTKVNERGPELSGDEVDVLLNRIAELATEATWVVAAGSLPAGVAPDFYARLAGVLPVGVRLAVDTEGTPLRLSLEAGVALVKPNRHELEQRGEHRLETLGDVIAAARIAGRGGSALLVSLGKDGAVLVDGEATAYGEARVDDLVNDVGAGDALLAGFLAGGATAGALATAIAWSVAACRSPGTAMRRVSVADEQAVVVYAAVDPARRLTA